MGLQGTSIPVAGGYVTTVYCPNEGAWLRLLALIDTINPDAFAPVPVPHSLAEAMLRDGVVAAPYSEPGQAAGVTSEGMWYSPADADLGDGMCYSPNFDGPPNCDGFHAVEAPMPPFEPLRDPEQDDDEGPPAEPPRCSTGGCGED